MLKIDSGVLVLAPPSLAVQLKERFAGEKNFAVLETRDAGNI